jgi:anion-transporting  ArsA/GET3 family ATPase
MDLGSLFIILSLTILVGIFVSRPLLDGKFTGSTPSGSSPDHELSSLLAERDRILNSLQELDFDAALGKIPPEDYPAQRASLLKRGADVLRRIDALAAPEAREERASVESRMASEESRIESVLAQRRMDGAQTGEEAVDLGQADEKLEIMLANRRRQRQGQSAGFCHKCGGPIQKVDQFCPKCGVKVK